MRTAFDLELKKLHNHFTEMGTMVSDAIVRATKAFADHDVNLAQSVIDDDKMINEKEIELERECARLIALQQPVVSDLRGIVSVMKACSDLERMGDHARSIAKTTIEGKGKKRIAEVEEQLEEMSLITTEMSRRVIVAYVNRDTVEARAIASLDSKVDQFLKSITQYTIDEMKADPQVVNNGSGYISTAMHLERTADYITNICERIVYIETGEITELN